MKRTREQAVAWGGVHYHDDDDDDDDDDAKTRQLRHGGAVGPEGTEKRMRSGDAHVQSPATRIVAFPYEKTVAEDGIHGDPFDQEVLLRKVNEDMRFWTCDRLAEMGKARAMEHLNRQLLAFNDLADFGAARARNRFRVERKVIPFDMDLDARVVLLMTGPTLDEQKHNGGYEGMVWDPQKQAQVKQRFYNAQLVVDFKAGVMQRTGGLDLSDVKFDRAFVVPMRKFDVTNVGETRVGNGSALFARYALVALCIVRPQIVVCMGREPARTMLVDLAGGALTAELPRERYNHAISRKVAEAGSRNGKNVLATLSYIETIHPFLTTQSDEQVTLVRVQGREVEDHIHRAQINAKLAAKRSILELTHQMVGSRLYKRHGAPIDINPFAVLMSNRILFDVPGIKLAGVAKHAKAAKAITYAYNGQQQPPLDDAGTAEPTRVNG